ncbi:sulfite exporter TauE/SafE family protein [Pseudomonas cavernicola]|uniref:Probable membrane transporter protein n=1 Tax=Pseudomonas cavernicola TaxID=2320866 RepID=A0A418XM61_9PSED|nr:sulfite exporter TauE/SafE family protein [Pseudomonas cavernicola]RJG13562.1 sulfite exporter TauE/SafE family protein [Pseudomonas cavernicola]
MGYSGIECLALLIVLFGSLVQGLLGIGFALLAAPLLYLLEPRYVPGPVLLLGFLLALCMRFGNRQPLAWRRPMPAILARLPGAWCGGLLLAWLSSAWLGLLLGCSVLLATIFSYRWLEVRCTPQNLAIAGFCSGLMGTATSVGGPPMALVYQGCSRVNTRDELAAFFLLTTPVSLLFLLYQGRMPLDYLSATFKLAPGVVAGYGLARCLEGRIDKRSPRQLLLLLSLLAAGGLLTVSLWRLWAKT